MASALLSPFYSFIDSLSGASGLPPDAVTTLFFMFLSFPLAFLHRMVLPKGHVIQHIYSASIGLIYTFLSFGASALHILGLCMPVYIMMLVSSSPKTLHRYVFVYAMGYLAVCHIYRMYVDYLGWTVDITGPLMIATLKVISIAYNYDDGRTEPQKLSKWEQLNAVTTVPSLIEYLGFIYFYPTILSGPSFNFSDYIHFTQAESPGKKRKFLGRLVVGICSFVGVYLSMSYDRSYFLHTKFSALPLYEKAFFIAFISFMYRVKYYAAWSIAESSCALSGFGMRVFKDDVLSWDYVRQANFLKVEFSAGLRDVCNYWNYGTALFVRHYVFNRYKRHKKGGLDKMMATYLVMALWHGFYPGYFIAFTQAAMGVELNKAYHRVVGSRVAAKSPPFVFALYRFLTWTFLQLAVGYVTAPFIILSWKESIQFYTDVYWMGQVVIVGGILLFNFWPRTRTPRSAEKKEH